MHSYILMNNIILVTLIIESPDNRGLDNRGSTVPPTVDVCELLEAACYNPIQLMADNADNFLST